MSQQQSKYGCKAGTSFKCTTYLQTMLYLNSKLCSLLEYDTMQAGRQTEDSINLFLVNCEITLKSVPGTNQYYAIRVNFLLKKTTGACVGGALSMTDELQVSMSL